MRPLNSGLLDTEHHLAAAEIAALFAGHEISCHSLDHPFPDRLPRGEWLRQILDDRRNLEALAGYPVTGMSYPYNICHDEIAEICRIAGILCARSGAATGWFGLPEDFMRWQPSCHHRDARKLLNDFQAVRYRLSLFFVWGHAYEFEQKKHGCDWAYIEDFCRSAGGDPEVWYATNIEVCRYITAIRTAVTGCDGRLIYNPSAETLCLRDENGQEYALAPHETLELK